MAETEQQDPLEIPKDPEVIKEAQNEIGKLDVLVCGECHDVFHYIEQLQDHKLAGNCSGASLLHDNQTEQKTQVWGFLLWKNAKFKNDETGEAPPSSWSIYQLWCNLESSLKDAWIAAGQSIQSSIKLSTSKFQDIKSVSCQTVATKSEEEEDPLEEGEIRLSALLTSQRSNASHNDSKMNMEVDPLAGTESESESEEDIEKELAEMEGIKRPRKKKKKLNNIKNVLKPVQLNSESNQPKDPATKKAMRTSGETKEECTIEKIISKRYNRGKKMFEFYIKWEGLEHEQNTWEPTAHVEPCKVLMEEFDKNMQKQKAQKLAQKQIISKKLEKSRLLEEMRSIPLTPGGRPQRTSKQKALNQVKVWCGNISDADDTGTKRIFSDSDSSDSMEKKIKLEADSSDSDYDRPPVTIKKVKQNILNGTGRKQPLPDNVLVPDAQGVIRINQKQLPALSSGVYVMSKTAGIIKLDSNTSKIATSGGHAVIKVAPKIGQTSIKVIKKESATNGSKPYVTNKLKPPARVYSSKVIKKTVSTLIKKPDSNPPAVSSKIFVDDEEDSDGLEELDFPTDMPLPTPDSPPGDFTLDPETGKIVGQLYPEEIKTEAQDSTDALENFVEMTAAQILQTEDKTTQKELVVTSIKPEQAEPVVSEADAGKSAGEAINTSSILSKALSIANIEPSEVPAQKKLNTPNVLRHKTAMNRNILNRTIVPQPQPQAIITRITPGAHRHRLPFQKHAASAPSNKKVVRQTYVNKNAVARKVAAATYQAVHEATEPTILNSTQSLVTSVGPVINMPLLTTETDQERAGAPSQVQEPEVATQSSISVDDTEISNFSLSDSETPLLITGEDGTIYQVAGQNEDGQTILITQGADGQQQCLLVASENTPELNEAVHSPVVEAQPVEESANADNDAESAEDSQVVAQIVDAQPPSPGGTRKVVLMLPDGNLMMTEVTAEQYAALELDK